MTTRPWQWYSSSSLQSTSDPSFSVKNLNDNKPKKVLFCPYHYIKK